jgi:hypothetical protein
MLEPDEPSSFFFLCSNYRGASLSQEEDQDKLKAAIEFIRKTGASQVQLRYSDDEHPMIWMVVAIYNGKNPKNITGVEVDASLSATRAALRLCERLADGGQCGHCGKPTGFEPDMITAMPLPDRICWYQYDPELKVYRRGCE